MKLDFGKGDMISTLIMWTLVLLFGFLAFKRGLFLEGLKESGNIAQDIFIRVVAAILLAGFAQILIPTELIGKLLGQEAGWKGIFFGWILGIFAPGGPFVAFPLMVVLYGKGASLAAIFSFLTSWSLFGVFRFFTWELPFLGAKIAFLRVLVSLWVPLAIGFLTRVVENRLLPLR